jgi:hypothetical protein
MNELYSVKPGNSSAWHVPPAQRGWLTVQDMRRSDGLFRVEFRGEYTQARSHVLHLTSAELRELGARLTELAGPETGE